MEVPLTCIIGKKPFQSMTQTVSLLAVIGLIFFFLMFFNANSPSYRPSSNLRRLLSKGSDAETELIALNSEGVALAYMNKACIGSWVSNTSLPHFNGTKGRGQFLFKSSFRMRHGIQSWVYRWNFYLFDGEYNSHSLHIATERFASGDAFPQVYIDKSNDAIFVNSSSSLAIKELRYLSAVDSKENHGRVTLKFSNQKSASSAMKALIEYDNISIELDLKTDRLVYFNFALMSLMMSGLVLLQQGLNVFMMDTLWHKQEEHLKYSSTSILMSSVFSPSYCILYWLISIYEGVSRYIYITLLQYYTMFWFILVIELCCSTILFFSHLYTLKLHALDKKTEWSECLSWIKGLFLLLCYHGGIVCVFRFSCHIFYLKALTYAMASLTFAFQIRLNLKRNKKEMISWGYIALISLRQLLFPLIFAVERHFFYFEKDCSFVVVLSIILAVQVVTLVIQKYYSCDYLHVKLFGVDMGEFDYFRTLKEVRQIKKEAFPSQCSICHKGFTGDNCAVIDSASSINADSAAGVQASDNLMNQGESVELAKMKQKKKKRCCLCFCCEREEIVMLTPCDHVFHRNCFQDWIAAKTNCPVCQADLPPVQPIDKYHID